MIGKNIFLILTLFFLLQKTLFATSLTGSLDNNLGSIYDDFTYTLVAEGSQLSDLPRFPNIDGLKVEEGGTSQSISIINGVTTKELSVSFLITPLKQGNYEIPSLTMQIDGKMYKTLPLKLTVTAQPARQAVTGDEKIFIERSLSKTKFYVGEPVLSTVKIFTRVDWQQPRRVSSIPDLLNVTPIKGEKTYRLVRGRYQYQVIELAEILTARAAGEIDLPPFRLKAHITDESRPQRRRGPLGFFSDQRLKSVTISSDPSRLKVLPLPKKGRPADFSGLVGVFELSRNLSADTINAGETLTLTLEVSGKGMAKGMRPPQLSLPGSIKVYQDKPEFSEVVDRTYGLRSKQVFKYALVPEKAENLELGSVFVSYFDTEKGAYRRLSVDLGGVRVKGGGEQKPVATLGREGFAYKQDVKVLGEDILGVYRGEAFDRAGGISDGDSFVLYGGPIFSSLFALFGGFLAVNRRDAGGRAEKRRGILAFKNYAGKVSRVKGLLAKENADAGEAAFLLLTAFKEYVADKGGGVAGALTSEDIKSFFSKMGASSEALSTVEKVLMEVDALHYGGVEATEDKVSLWIAHFDKVLQNVEAKV